MTRVLYNVCTSGGGRARGPPLTALNGSSSSASLPGPLENSELLKTPPKRKTARKHTGRVSVHTSGERCSSSSSQIEGTSEISKANGDGGKSPPSKRRKTGQEMGDSRGSESEREQEKLEVGTEQGVELVADLRDKQADEEGEKVSETLTEEEAVEEMEVSREEKDQSIQEQEREEATTKVSKKSSTTPGRAEKKPIHPFFSKYVVWSVFSIVKVINCVSAASCTPKKSTGEAKSSSPATKKEER